MTPATKATHFTPPDIPERIRAEVITLLSRYMQPSARELHAYLVEKLGWGIRWDLETVLKKMVSEDAAFQKMKYGRALTRSEKDYIFSLLESNEIAIAIRGTDAPDKQLISSIDNLVKQSQIYRNSRAFSEMIEFMARFRDYAPYNNMLVRIQNPECSFYATAKDWKRKFKRDLIEDANPMLILAPMHPVLLVYDLDQTEGQPVPEELLKFAHFEGAYNPDWLDRMLLNASGYRIRVDFKTLSSTSAGFATLARETGEWKMRIAIHDKLDGPSRLGVLCHELAHILLGHLGTDEDLWWPCRSNLTHRTVEIEAEASAYIATIRLGLTGSSAACLSRYLGQGGLPQSVSMDLIAKVSGQLERMIRQRMPARRLRGAREQRRAQ